MKTSLVLVSHGSLAEGLKQTTEMIMGPQEDIHTVTLLPGESRADFERKFDAETASLADFVVFCDLEGGTPSNVVSKKIIDGAPIKLYAGMNVPMVIGFINGKKLETPVDPVLEGQSHIHYVNELLQSADDDLNEEK